MSSSEQPSLDITAGEPETADATPTNRAWLGIRFDCCGVYARIYRNISGTEYEGACPRCMRRLRVSIGEGGTNQRIFRAS